MSQKIWLIYETGSCKGDRSKIAKHLFMGFGYARKSDSQVVFVVPMEVHSKTGLTVPKTIGTCRNNYCERDVVVVGDAPGQLE